MELGQRLRQARLEAGLSQRQLCGEEITRNMLSQIENGSARPSMQTLGYLASRLGKSVSFFLEEQTVTSPNQQVMEAARAAWAAGDPQSALQALESYREEDAVFDSERFLIAFLASMALAEEALACGKDGYCVTLLEQAKAAADATPYCTPALERQRLLLLARAKPKDSSAIAAQLPDNLQELLVRAAGAASPERRIQILDAAQPTDDPQWHLLRGQACMEQKDYRQALQHLKQAEDRYPARTWPLLEHCCRELEDFKMAYFYACKAREHSP